MKFLNATGIFATSNLLFNGSLPRERTSVSYRPSACANGGTSSSGYAYSCPHHAILSDDMLRAAKKDGLSQNFLYATAGANKDDECGKCYQVQLLQAEKVWRSDFPMYVVMVTNSGFDVTHGSLDIFVGAGGMGYFTALNSDCKKNYCNGGACREGMYEGNFTAWTDAQYPDVHKCYEGGVKFVVNSTLADIKRKCKRLTNSTQNLKNKILWDTCIRGNQAKLHQNFYGSRYTRVQCPESLYRLIGIRRSDDYEYPFPHPSNQLDHSISNTIGSGHPALTTMSDGCRPSCSWSGKVQTVQGYTAVDVCDRNGRVLSVY